MALLPLPQSPGPGPTHPEHQPASSCGPRGEARTQTRAAPGSPRLTPSLHPRAWKAPQRRCPQTRGGGRRLRTDHPPSCWPATRQHTHSIHVCTPCSEHSMERSCRDPQTNILHLPRESRCRGCFSGRVGGPGWGEVVCCPRPREEPGGQRNCQSTALGGESAPSEGLYPRLGRPRRLGTRLPGALTHPGPRPATCPCAGQGRCRHTLGRAAALTEFQGTGSGGHAPRRPPQELVQDSCWHPSGHVCRWASPGLAHLDSR